MNCNFQFVITKTYNKKEHQTNCATLILKINIILFVTELPPSWFHGQNGNMPKLSWWNICLKSSHTLHTCGWTFTLNVWKTLRLDLWYASGFFFSCYKTGLQIVFQSLYKKNFSNECRALCLGTISPTKLITMVFLNFKHLFRFLQLPCSNYSSKSSKPCWAFCLQLSQWSFDGNIWSLASKFV